MVTPMVEFVFPGDIYVRFKPSLMVYKVEVASVRPAHFCSQCFEGRAIEFLSRISIRDILHIISFQVNNQIDIVSNPDFP